MSVIDSGKGIEIKDQDKLFKLFGFLEDRKLLNRNGIGLGLVISKNITLAFGGDITFQSTPGSGSNFKFTFNLSKKDDLALAQNDKLFHANWS